MKTLVLDLETRELVRDWTKPWEAGVSVCGVWISWMGGASGRFRLYDSEGLDNLIRLIEASDVVVTYNGDSFDLPLIGGLVRGFRVRRHVDLLAMLLEASGRRWRLEDISRATLGRNKTGKGSSAPHLWERHQFASLHSYCLDDVALTRDLYKFATTHGYLLAPSDEGIRQIPLDLAPGTVLTKEIKNGRTSPKHRDFTVHDGGCEKVKELRTETEEELADGRPSRDES